MISIDPAIAGAVISFFTLLALLGGGFFWLGKLSNRVGHLENRVDQLVEEIRDMREELREEIRRGNQQLLLALASHSHDADGQPIFRVPVNPE
ncbi:MAG: hypothetical protein J4G13_12120 [Dehalococcoidia bacterium]|nr:hypothetical protein [Dehalococcoidia bacterium]